MRQNLTIIIPTLNCGDLLLDSVVPLLHQSKEFDGLIILDNGNQNLRIEHPKAIILNNPKNLGVGPSWNLGLKAAFSNKNIEYVLALNDDIKLGKTQLKEIKDIIEANKKDKWFFVGPYYWSVWAMTRAGWEAMQYEPDKAFDEAFFPAYFEDNDFHYRMRLIDESKYMGNISAFSPEICRNSVTKERNPGILGKRGELFEKNKKYYTSKWGGKPGCETFKTPFNK